MKLQLEKASPEHGPALTALQHACTDALLAKGIRQWTYRNVTSAGSFYVLMCFWQIIQGLLLYKTNAMYAYRIAMHPDYQGRG